MSSHTSSRLTSLRNAGVGLAFLTCAGLAAVPAQAQVEWTAASGGNGHFYQFLSNPVTWDDAEAQAASLTYQGQSGYLATITSAEENSFIVASVPEAVSNNAWLGGYQPAGSVEPGGGWSWITGETWSYTNWNPGEPNNGLTGEDRLHFLGGSGGWNDLSSTNFTGEAKGFLVEYNSPVPEASSVVSFGVLLALGLGGVAVSRRRKGVAAA